MADKTLEQVLQERSLLQKPEPLGFEPVQLPPAAPGSLDEMTSHFTSGLLGDQKPGSIPSGLGAMAGMFLPGRHFRDLKGLGTAVLTRRVAPKRVADELASALLGRSNRVPTPSVYKPLSESDASLEAMLLTRTHTQPPPPTVLQVMDPNFTRIQRQIRRPAEITEAYKARQKALGAPIKRQQTITINASSTTPKKEWAGSLEKAADLRKVKPIVESAGSLHDAGLKPLTRREIQALMEGPVKAFKGGHMSHTEMRKVLEANKAKIATRNKEFSEADWNIYKQAMERAILNKGGKL